MTRSEVWLRHLAVAVVAVAGAALVLALEGCGSRAPNTIDRLPTAADVAVRSGSLVSASGCSIGFDSYLPATGNGGIDIVLAHGFLRDRARMAGLARAFARAGYATAAVDLCNMRPWDGAHRQNAADLQRVAAALASAPVVYAGFSAGGLAALLAAAEDPAARGVLVLDLVDQDGIGAAAAATLQAPLIGLVGEPSACNADNNGAPVLAAARGAEVRRIAGATHCDFESPTDGLCRLLCEPSDRSPTTVQRINREIVDAAVEAARRLLRDTSSALQLIDLARATPTLAGER